MAGYEAPNVCGNCRDQLSDGGIAVCPGCARPLPEFALPCPTCHRRPFRFQRTVAIGVYEGPLREAVLRAKRLHYEHLAFALGQLLADTCLDAGLAPDFVVPAPMHWLRHIRRGINGPELLAEAVAARMRRPCWKLLRNRRKTNKQGTLLPAARRANVRGAFVTSAGYDLRDAHVLLIDDVMTTGATANELSRVLLVAGAATVSVAVVARGVGFD
jgi:ComF family protein